jgi:hypothetical protein
LGRENWLPWGDFGNDLLSRIHSQTGHLGQVLDGILMLTEIRL